MSSSEVNYKIMNSNNMKYNVFHNKTYMPDAGSKVGCLMISFVAVLSACAPEKTVRPLELPELPQSPWAVAAPIFIQQIAKPEHADFSAQTAQVNLPNASLEEALIVAMPFQITIQPMDSLVDVRKPVGLRVTKGTTVKNLLHHLSRASGYRINYLPEEKIIQIAALETKTWHLSGLLGRTRTVIALGGDDTESSGDSPDDDNEGSDASKSVRTTYDSATNSVWDVVMNQVNCALETPACSLAQDTADDGDGPQGTSSSQGRPAADGSWMIAQQGVLTATAPPEKIRNLDSWLTPLEQNLQRFVRLQVALVNIRKDRKHDRGLNLEALLRSDDDSFGITFHENPPRNQTAGALLLSANPNLGNLTLAAMIRLLNERTDSEVLHQVSLIVPGGETATINSIETFYFAAGSEVIPGDANNQQRVSTSLRQESVGIELAVTPQFMQPESDEISVRVLPVISSFLGQDEVVSNGITVSQAPRVALNHFSSHAVLRDGRAMIVGGLSSQSNESARQDLPGGASLRLFGGRSQRMTDNELIVIILAQEIEV